MTAWIGFRAYNTDKGGKNKKGKQIVKDMKC